MVANSPDGDCRAHSDIVTVPCVNNFFFDACLSVSCFLVFRHMDIDTVIFIMASELPGYELAL